MVYFRKRGNRIWLFYFALFLVLNGFSILAGPVTNNLSLAERADKVYRDAHKRFDSDLSNNEAGWQLARACFERCEFASSEAERARIANEGIAAARHVI